MYTSTELVCELLEKTVAIVRAKLIKYKLRPKVEFGI